MSRVLTTHDPNPPQLVWAQQRGEQHVVALVQRPQVHQVTWAWGDRMQLFDVATPFVVCVIALTRETVGGLYIYYSVEVPSQLEDRLCHGNFPNTWGDDQVCIGEEEGHAALNALLAPLGLPRERAAQVIQYFWDSPFTYHAPENYFEMGLADSRYQSIDSWAVLSRANAKAVLTTEWRPSCTLQEALTRAWRTLE